MTAVHHLDPRPEGCPAVLLLHGLGAEADSCEKGGPRAYRSAMRALGLFNSMRRLSEIQIPTLVVTGRSDTTVPPVSQGSLVQGIRGARQVVIGNAGHAVTIDQPEVFNQALLGFLEQV